MTQLAKYRVIGMMSGTSLDGVDLSFCQYWQQKKWCFKLIAAKTYPYPLQILQTIQTMQNKSTTFIDFKKQEIKYSQFISNVILSFINQFQLHRIDFLSLHGHTIFHHPKQKITVQALNLATVAANTKIDTIANFRQLDVMRGGQGAPLAPFGEELFQGDIFINFGGVANLGCNQKGWDILYCNLFFNHFAKIMSNSEFDKDGLLGRKGNIKKQVWQFLRQYWTIKKQNSLEREVFQILLEELLNRFRQIRHQDILHTYYHYLTSSIISSINQAVEISLKGHTKKQKIKVVCTGGGAKNQFLMELLQIKKQNILEIYIPCRETIQFKEAIIFGLLGVKYIQGNKNSKKGIGGCMMKGSIT